MIRSEDLIHHFKSEIAKNKKVEWITDQINEVHKEQGIAIGEVANYSADMIFDSRFDFKEIKKSKKPYVLQHFKGWFIETENEVFDPDEFVMMDYRFPYPDQCSFIYILPLSKKQALIEYTFFSPELLEEKSYDELLKGYLDQFYPAINYQIKKTESGVIPMSSMDFQAENLSNYLKIGTAGGWVKASSGYSFKHAEKKSQLIAENLKNGNSAGKGLFKSRFKLYDRIFLNLLQHENELGNRVFQQMYRKNSIQDIFEFLDEESSPAKELRLINRFDHLPFIRALFREFF